MTTNSDLQRAMNAIRQLQFDEAIALLSKLLAGEPTNTRARWLLVQSLESNKDTNAAIEQLRLLLIHVKKDLPAIDQIAGHMRQRRYPLDNVLRAYQKYLKYQPESANAAFNYAYNLAKEGQFASAISQYERALEIGIDRPEEVHLNIANIYMDHLHEHNEASAQLEKALVRNPAYSGAYYNLGNLSEQEGDRRKARTYFEKCLQADPANESALARLADTQKFAEKDDPLLGRLSATAENSENSDVHLALGKAYEQLGEFGLAWQHFTKGNRLDERIMPAYNAKQTEVGFSRIMTQCSRSWLDQFEGSSAEPVFICGMFRTGSTLLEQMLAAHPRFVAGGESEFFPRLIAKEFPDYPQGLADVMPDELRLWQQQHLEQTSALFGASSRLTDKRPDNFLYIGLIKAVLPSAKFIVTERDWRDVATSIYSVRLGASQPYATSLENIRHYIDLQTELIKHWETVLGSDLMRISYEDLVLQPKRALTGLLGWLGEDWDERCLSFHELKNSVKTASVWQVREPLHAKSISRWKNYHDQFADIFGAELSD